jgi:NAD(P)-dependent dehydrogenase (short-subunit alcohol dehydrogenase family)
MPFEVWEQLFRTNLFGPVRLTQALLQPMRSTGRGRIVVVSSQGGIRGMPSISAYSASKGALERWAEALAEEVAPFGLGVTILVSGTFDTEILTEQTPHHGDMNGPYARHYVGIERTGRAMVQRLKRPPGDFARELARALDDRSPFVRHGVGIDARLLMIGNRFLGRLLHHLIARAMGLPRRGSLSERSSNT